MYCTGYLQLESEDLWNWRRKWLLLRPETAAFPPVTFGWWAAAWPPTTLHHTILRPPRAVNHPRLLMLVLDFNSCSSNFHLWPKQCWKWLPCAAKSKFPPLSPDQVPIRCFTLPLFWCPHTLPFSLLVPVPHTPRLHDNESVDTTLIYRYNY